MEANALDLAYAVRNSDSPARRALQPSGTDTQPWCLPQSGPMPSLQGQDSSPTSPPHNLPPHATCVAPYTEESPLPTPTAPARQITSSLAKLTSHQHSTNGAKTAQRLYNNGTVATKRPDSDIFASKPNLFWQYLSYVRPVRVRRRSKD
jgi:hypothetical protein